MKRIRPGLCAGFALYALVAVCLPGCPGPGGSDGGDVTDATDTARTDGGDAADDGRAPSDSSSSRDVADAGDESDVRAGLDVADVPNAVDVVDVVDVADDAPADATQDVADGSQSCNTNADCPGYPGTEYCDKPFGQCSAVGVCTQRTTFNASCGNNPTCACDGYFYLCTEERTWLGFTPTNEPGICTRQSCTSDADCPSPPIIDHAMMCYKPDGCNQPGYCAVVPHSPCQHFVPMVCGCDHQAYSGACEALESRVNVNPFATPDDTGNCP